MMTDPLDALRAPLAPVDPDPAFAARLRGLLRDALLDTPSTPTGGDMTETTNEDLAWGPTLAPYLAVADGRRAIDWYVDVFGARQRGEPYVQPDGSIGHAELAIGDAVLMLSEPTGDVPVRPPSGGPVSHTVHAQVDDVDATVARARSGGATVEREPGDQPYGRVAVVVDPFGHRWMLNTPPPGATRTRPGDVAYVTMVVPDDERATAFYGAVLGWRFAPGSGPGMWRAEGVRPSVGLWGDPAQPREVQLCYRVADVAAAADRVREHGGEAGEVDRRPYGLMADCVDDQGTRFQLWQPG
jgi:uncharacterized glyoxalase superfamily protein PhnB